MKTLNIKDNNKYNDLTKIILFLLLSIQSMSVSAVTVNHQGMGEVIILPYYTVNNDLNTIVSVTNTTEHSKAVKINFREGLNGYAALSYNVYLNGYDTWTFGLINRLSTAAGFEGQASVMHVSLDESCAPFLIKSGQEFLPDELFDGPQDMSRTREGFIEIIEMGELEGEFVQAAEHGNTGIPEDCGTFESAWQAGGQWHTESGGATTAGLSPVTGGLVVEADLINVAAGINFSTPVVALDGFFAADSISHVAPGDTGLSLDAAAPNAVVYANGQSYGLRFDSGQDAVSAVLMADQLIGTYGLDLFIGGQSEAIYIQPTRRFYLHSDSTDNLPPYNADEFVNSCPESFYGGTEVEMEVFDRESQVRSKRDTCAGIGTCPPPPPNEAICGSVFVQSMVLPGYSDRPQITDSNNYNSPINSLESASHATENGFVKSRFLDTRPLIGTDVNTSQSIQLMGLPIIGITLQQYTNASAAAGLLAQYGGSHLMRSTVTVVEEN